MTGRGAVSAILTALLAALLMSLAAPAFAQLTSFDPEVLAARMNYLMPSPDAQMRQAARMRDARATPAALRKRGMAEAPALATQAGLNCDVVDARWIAEAPPGRGKPGRTWYEIACKDDLGYILAKAQDAPASAVTCLEIAIARPHGGHNDLRCELPENSDLRVGLVPYIARTGKDCPPEKVREIGHSATRTAFELACQDGEGFVMMTSAPPRLDKPIEIHPCLGYPEGATVSCLYTDRKAQLAIVDRLISQAGIACAVKDRAYVGESDRDDASYWEASCQDGRGWLLTQGPDGKLAGSVDCAQARSVIAGGCELTQSGTAPADEAALYGQRVSAAGFPCKVSDYAVYAARPDGATAVELACAGRPAGAVAFIPSTGAATVVDCAHAELMGYGCHLSQVSAAYPDLTADLRAVGEKSCIVSDARTLGVTPDHHAYAEVACANGLPGYMIEYRLEPIKPVDATICSQAQHIGSGCALPENRRS